MAIINDVNEVLHRIRVKLYPNYLPGAGGAYIARTENEATLSITEVCAALKNRGGFTGSYEDLQEYVKQFFNEAAYQLCDGFSVDMKYFSVHPNVGGTFDKATEAADPKRHPVSFRFRTRQPLRALTQHVHVDVAGLADAQAYIDEFVDVTTESVNEALTPGGLFTVSGHKIKLAGDAPEVGVYFVKADDPAQRVKVAGHLAENLPAKLIGIIPPLAPGRWKLGVITQFSAGSSLLKDLRVIEFGVELAVH